MIRVAPRPPLKAIKSNRTHYNPILLSIIIFAVFIILLSVLLFSLSILKPVGGSRIGRIVVCLFACVVCLYICVDCTGLLILKIQRFLKKQKRDHIKFKKRGL